MRILRAGNIRRLLLLVIALTFSLSFPFSIYDMNGRFDIKSVLFFIRYDSSVASVSIHFISDYDFIWPALLICFPCLLWLWKIKDLRAHELLISAGLVILTLTGILMYYLPSWFIFPWFSGGVVIAVIPEFYNLLPFSGLVFTILVLLPLVWRGFTYPQTNGMTHKESIIAGILFLFVVLSPLTLELFSLQVSGPFAYYDRDFNLQSVFWSFSYTIDGSNLGYNTVTSFFIPSVYSVLALAALSLPGFVFIWLVLKSHYDRYAVASIITAGAIHLLTLFLACISISEMKSLPSWWIVIPSPILLVCGLIIMIVRTGYMLNLKRRLSQTKIAVETPIQPQM
jgi:hypothetical protein